MHNTKSQKLEKYTHRLIILILLFQTTIQISASENIKSLNSNLSITDDGIIIFKVPEDMTSRENLFDLEGRTLKFIPTSEGYQVSNQDLNYIENKGKKISNSLQKISNFEFSFSQENWSEFYVNERGTISFGKEDPYYNFSLRWQTLSQISQRFIGSNSIVALNSMTTSPGNRWINELNDKVVVSWEFSDTWGGLQDRSMAPNRNIFQVVLYKDGVIDFNYKKIDKDDSIVGIFPEIDRKILLLNKLSEVNFETNSSLPNYLDPVSISVFKVAGYDLAVKITFEDYFELDDIKGKGVSYTIRSPGMAWQSTLNLEGFFDNYGGLREVSKQGKDLIFYGTLSGTLLKLPSEGEIFDINVRIDERNSDSKGWLRGKVVMPAHEDLEVDFSLAEGARIRNFAHEVFHYRDPVNRKTLACNIFPYLEDKYDFLASYSSFPLDKAEGGSGMEVVKNDVIGIGKVSYDNTQSYCNKGRLRGILADPFYINSNVATSGGPNGVNDDFSWALRHLAHEFGHIWLAGRNTKALIDGVSVKLEGGGDHWAKGLHAPVAHPWIESVEASTMGGSYWSESFDGSFAEKASNQWRQAVGYSYLDLYLMGLTSKFDVPDFFVIDNLYSLNILDNEGKQLYQGDRIDVKIDDVIAYLGERKPDFRDSQKDFNTAFVYLVEPGGNIVDDHLSRIGEIRDSFSNYFSYVTGGVATMNQSDRVISDDTSKNPVIVTTNHITSILVDKDVLGASPVVLQGLTETIEKTDGVTTNHVFSYKGSDYDYDDISPFIMIAVRDNEFTDDFRSELADYAPEFEDISYQQAVEAVGLDDISDAIIEVAGADGSYID